jgi:hypothetical protein
MAYRPACATQRHRASAKATAEGPRLTGTRVAISGASRRTDLPSRQARIATHSPILLSYPHAKIVQFDSTGVAEIGFEDTEHFAVTRDFLNNYPRRLEQLLQDDVDTKR